MKYLWCAQKSDEYVTGWCRYPVILSFENHCSVEQQKVMAMHLRNILGGIKQLHDTQPSLSIYIMHHRLFRPSVC